MKYLFLLALLGGCIHPKVKFHKQAILDPLMDPAKENGSSGMFSLPMGAEKSSLGGGGAVGGTCPTCSG